ncbi:ORF370 [White spot syndrome virus]|nr:ORF370 [White spot syndrome virus]
MSVTAGSSPLDDIIYSSLKAVIANNISSLVSPLFIRLTAYVADSPFSIWVCLYLDLHTISISLLFPSTITLKNMTTRSPVRLNASKLSTSLTTSLRDTRITASTSSSFMERNNFAVILKSPKGMEKSYLVNSPSSPPILKLYVATLHRPT